MTNSDHEWRRFFNDHAPDYMTNEFTSNTLAEVDFIIDQLQLAAGSSILDVGCGTGRHSVELAKRGYTVTGIDLSDGMLKEAGDTAARAGVTVTFMQADATAFHMDTEFDAVICLCEGAFGLLSSTDDPGEHDLAILRNINRALKPGGRFLLTALNGFKLVRKYSNEDVASGRFDPLFMTERYDYEYETAEGTKSIRATERGFAPSELRLMLLLSGFDVLHLGGGTAGNWDKRNVDLDEYELMAICRKARGVE